MLALTRQYPSIAIIAGTVAITKTHQSISPDLKTEISNIYEKANAHEQKCRSSEGEKHQTIFDKVTSSNHPSGVIAVRNSCFIFTGDICRRLDKLYPFHELRDPYTKSLDTSQTFFQPGKYNTINPIIPFIHPYTFERFTIGIEICRAHFLGGLKQAVKSTQSNCPDLHIVLSDSIECFPSKIYADNFILIDSISSTLFISQGESNESKNINILSSSLL